MGKERKWKDAAGTCERERCLSCSPTHEGGGSPLFVPHRHSLASTSQFDAFVVLSYPLQALGTLDYVAQRRMFGRIACIYLGDAKTGIQPAAEARDVKLHLLRDLHTTLESQRLASERQLLHTLGERASCPSRSRRLEQRGKQEPQDVSSAYLQLLQELQKRPQPDIWKRTLLYFDGAELWAGAGAGRMEVCTALLDVIEYLLKHVEQLTILITSRSVSPGIMCNRSVRFESKAVHCGGLAPDEAVHLFQVKSP